MAKLGWGTPTLVSLSLGVIIEIPGNVAIVGVLKVALPAEDDRGRRPPGQLHRRASSSTSRAAGSSPACSTAASCSSPSTARWACSIAFGDDANFVLAVGGFHPRFTPPPLPFPTPHRIAVDILNTSVARLRAEAYFAITTNTVQFGASPRRSSASVRSTSPATSQFDALIRFSPFYFIVDFSSHFSVKVFGVGVWGLRIRLEVEGPDAVARAGLGGHLAAVLRHRRRLRRHLGRAPRHHCRRSAVMPSWSRSCRKPRLAARCRRPAPTCWSRCASCPRQETAIVLHPLGSPADQPAVRAARRQARPRRRPAALRRRAVHARRRQHRVRPSGATSTSASRRRSSRTSPTTTGCPRRPSSRGTAGSSSRPTHGVRLGRRRGPGRPLRADHHRHQRQGAPPALLVARGRCCSRHWLAGCGRQPVAAQRQARWSSGCRWPTASRRSARPSRWRCSTTTSRPARERRPSPAQGARDGLAGLDRGGRPGSWPADARRPAVRGGGA